MTALPTSFLDALHADGPDPARADKLRLYGQFVGAWDSDLVTHGPDGATHQGRGEIHFGWVLEGRAIQDVWMIPRRGERRAGAPQLPVAGNWYGTTLRVFDPGVDAWHIFWIDPATLLFTRQLGRARGADIVQEGAGVDSGATAAASGGRSRWSFTNITPSSFRWTAETSPDGGASWRLLVEVQARRR